MLRVPSNDGFQNSSSNVVQKRSSSSNNDHRSSTSTVNSSKNGDPTVASLGVRHLSPAVVTSPASTLMTRSIFVDEPKGDSSNGGNNFSTPANNKASAALMGTSSSLSSGTGTTSPVSSSSPRLSTCSSTLALNENNVPMSTADRIIRELVDTENAYVRDLEDVIIGYIVPLRIERILPESDIECIFSNIEEIYYLNKRLLMRMQKAIDRSSGASSLSVLSRCFSDKSNCEKLVNTYRRYCASFAASSTRLESIQHNHSYANVTRHIRDLQVSLGHTLPLFAYLLKPVQRILKYQLLWQKLAEQFDVSTPEHGMAFDAAISMIHIAQLINSCISLPNNPTSSSSSSSQHGQLNNNNNCESSSVPLKASTLRAQASSSMTSSAITMPTFSQSSVNLKHHGQQQDYKMMMMMSCSPPTELVKPSPSSVPGHQPPSFVRVIVMQGQLQMRGAKHPRHVILFDSSLVVYKVHRLWRKSQEQEQLIHQVTIPASSLKLCEVPEKTSNLATFSVEAVLEPRSSYTFQAESIEKKQLWCDAIGNVILSETGNSSSSHQQQRDPSNSNKRHAAYSCQMSSSITVVTSNNNNNTISSHNRQNKTIQSRRSASPFAGLEEATITNSSTSNNNNTVTSQNHHRQHHRRLGSTKSDDTTLMGPAPPPCYASVGIVISADQCCRSNNDLKSISDRPSAVITTAVVKATGDGNATTTTPPGGGGWVDSTGDPRHQSINRTDSEKWQERNRWKAKSATIDRQNCPNKHARGSSKTPNTEETTFHLVGANVNGGKCVVSKVRVLVPWQNAQNKRTFVRRPSFVSDSHLLRVAQQRHQQQKKISCSEQRQSTTPASCLMLNNTDNGRNSSNSKTPTLNNMAPCSSQETPSLPPSDAANHHRYSRSNGLRRFFDAVAKRFRSSDRTSKSLIYTSGTAADPVDGDSAKQTVMMPSLTTSLSATTSEFLQQTTTPIMSSERCITPAPPQDETRPSSPLEHAAAVKLQRVAGNTVERSSGLGTLQTVASKQASCSALLFTPRHASLTNQQRQVTSGFKAGFKKKSDNVRTAKIAHWAASGVPPRDVFV